MDNVIDLQLEHRTIRQFTDEKVGQMTMDKLFQVINRTATSMGMQAYSLIRVIDKEKRKALAEVTSQDYIVEVPELLIFVVDQFRNSQIGLEAGKEPMASKNMDSFFQGFTDGILAAQNLMLAIESLGMGGVYFGSILNDPERVIEILNLPKLTYPILGVGFGYPNQDPQKKPRMDMKLKVFENEYRVFDSYSDLIKDYDEVIQTYYDLRDSNKRLDSFTNQVINKYGSHNEKRANMLKIIEKQGFILEV